MSERTPVPDSAERRRERRVDPSLLGRASPGVLIALVAIAAFVSIGLALDDAYIVYRYVVRFVGGQGLTFNDNEYVEGFTSLVWTLLVSLAA